jgi:phosphatidylcholine synthase
LKREIRGSYLSGKQSRSQVFFALLVHGYTASGFIWALLVALSIVDRSYYLAGVWMLVAIAVDSTDGFLARYFRVNERIPLIEGRKLDDLADYLNYTFLPIFMIVHAGWVPEPGLIWGSIPLIASGFAFSNLRAKNEESGYFLGFPSYWNVFAIYVLVWFSGTGTYWPTLILILLFSVISLLPIRFVYPSKAVKWKGFFIWGGVAWTIGIMAVLLMGEGRPMWLVYLTSLYPIAYLLSPLLFLSRVSGPDKMHS